jgi:heme exporter protein B
MSPGPVAVFAAVLRRDLRVAWRRWADAANPALFFVLVVTLFPLALSPKPEFLRSIAPGVLWVAALLATLLALDRLFRSDLEDGSLEQLVLADCPLALIMLAKVLAHWLVSGIPVLVMAPFLAITYHLPAAAVPVMLLSLLLGMPALCLIGAVGAALTVGLRQGGALLAVMVGPLMLPVLMLGARATDLAALGEDPTGVLYLLGAVLALAVGLAPLGTALGVRISVE